MKVEVKQEYQKVVDFRPVYVYPVCRQVPGYKDRVVNTGPPFPHVPVGFSAADLILCSDNLVEYQIALVTGVWLNTESFFF